MRKEISREAKVMTLAVDPPSTGWLDVMQKARRTGVKGEVYTSASSTSGERIYQVKHEDGSYAWYESRELALLDDIRTVLLSVLDHYSNPLTTPTELEGIAVSRPPLADLVRAMGHRRAVSDYCEVLGKEEEPYSTESAALILVWDGVFVDSSFDRAYRILCSFGSPDIRSKAVFKYEPDMSEIVETARLLVNLGVAEKAIILAPTGDGDIVDVG